MTTNGAPTMNLVPGVQVTIIDDLTCEPVALTVERATELLHRAWNPSQLGKVELGGFEGDYLVELAPELLGDVSFSIYFAGRKFEIEVMSEAR